MGPPARDCTGIRFRRGPCLCLRGWFQEPILYSGESQSLGQEELLETFLSTVEFTAAASRTALGGQVVGPGFPAAEVREGPLEPGRYEFLGLGGPAFVNAAFTVPAGWIWSGSRLTVGSERDNGASIHFFQGPVQVNADPCHWATSESTSARSVAELMAALVAQPMRSATTPINRPEPPPPNAELGWAGMTVRLTVPEDADVTDCDEGMIRSWVPAEGDGPTKLQDNVTSCGPLTPVEGPEIRAPRNTSSWMSRPSRARRPMSCPRSTPSWSPFMSAIGDDELARHGASHEAEVARLDQIDDGRLPNRLQCVEVSMTDLARDQTWDRLTPRSTVSRLDDPWDRSCSLCFCYSQTSKP